MAEQTKSGRNTQIVIEFDHDSALVAVHYPDQETPIGLAQMMLDEAARQADGHRRMETIKQIQRKTQDQAQALELAKSLGTGFRQ